MQNLPPIFSPHLFAFNNAPQGQYMTVTSGLSVPETARAAQQQGPEGPLKDNLPLGDERVNARWISILTVSQCRSCPVVALSENRIFSLGTFRLLQGRLLNYC